MAVLETIMAANAAYGVIKKCLENGREVNDMVSHVGKFLSAEDELKEAVKRKKNNPITAITGGSEGDWEEFQAKAKLDLSFPKKMLGGVKHGQQVVCEGRLNFDHDSTYRIRFQLLCVVTYLLP